MSHPISGLGKGKVAKLPKKRAEQTIVLVALRTVAHRVWPPQRRSLAVQAYAA
jgi:hypothetical protein